ncbi:transcriptional regulator, LysR family [Marinobacter zhejiangensis]|uniref:Transcriptional regulator, LysR family n=2 Tax=Marinobacter zhejiangensis TaxID=488535 RepID=A0A1I4Q1J2_9GAMM|nr:transcriptional regulator, LysR family [Marinobacter zhejiangensis]
MCKYAQMNWSHLEYFLAVADCGSLSSAAKQLQVNHSTVARRLEKLEQELGIRLFDRLSHGYQLTEHGLALQQHAQEVADKITQIQRVFRGRESALGGTLKVAKPDAGILNLATLLTEFHHHYPNIALELTAAADFSNLSRMEADVALRLTDSPPEHLIGRQLGRFPIRVYGSHHYLKLNSGAAPETLSWLIWTGHDSDLDLEARLKAALPQARVVLRTNNYSELYEAVCAGMGVSLLSPLRLPDDHHLQMVAPEQFRFDIGLWLLNHPDLRNNSRVRAFRDFATLRLQAWLR